MDYFNFPLGLTRYLCFQFGYKRKKKIRKWSFMCFLFHHLYLLCLLVFGQLQLAHETLWKGTWSSQQNIQPKLLEKKKLKKNSGLTRKAWISFRFLFNGFGCSSYCEYHDHFHRLSFSAQFKIWIISYISIHMKRCNNNISTNYFFVYMTFILCPFYQASKKATFT